MLRILPIRFRSVSTFTTMPLACLLMSLATQWLPSARPAHADEPRITNLANENGQTQADDARYLIIHADDAGMSHSVNVATFQGLESGIVTSASIMVPCPWFKEFAQYAASHPQYDYGIHLTLNSEWDVYRWGPVAGRSVVPSMVDPEGYLWDNVDQVREHVKAEEMRIELKAQIDKALAFGVPLSHLDTHMGAVLCRPDLVEVYIQLGIDYDLPVLFLSRMSPELKQGYPSLVDRYEAGFAKLTAKKLPMLDHLIQIYGGENAAAREAEYKTALNHLQPGVSELIIHCGIDNDELKAITNSASRRDQDLRLFTNPEIKKMLDDQGVKLLSWKEHTQRLRQPK